MSAISSDFRGQEVAVVISGAMPLTILGRLIDTDEHFVRLVQRNDGGEMLIPFTSVMHITKANGKHDREDY